MALPDRLGPFNGDEPIPLGAPSIRYYPFIVTHLGDAIYLPVCANHYEAERMLNLHGSNPDYAGLYIDMAQIAGTGPTDGER